MIKLVALFKRKAGMSMDEFSQYYENNHVPLVKKYMPQIIHYRRNYIIPGSTLEAGHMDSAAPPLPAFDVITEVWFENREQYDAMIAVTSDPKIGAIIADDEAKFFDRTSMTMFLVDEHITE